MGLQRFERGLERLVEGTFAKVFRSGLQPVELGRRLAREMDLQRTVGVRGVVAPNQFSVSLSQDDFDRFETFMDALKRELIESVREHARSERYSFVGPVNVNLDVDRSLTAGLFLVSGEVEEAPGGGILGTLSMSNGMRVEIGESPVSIGRLPECDITLPDPNVSRRHAEVRRLGNDFIFVDLGSTNGSKVNGAWVTGERRLNDGDEITTGATVIRFERA